jgi:two-component system chemotaxis response regulator CheY
MTPDNNTRILIVEKNRTMLRLIRSLLNDFGYTNIDEANSGSAALECLRDNKNNLIISDWNIEPVSGLELLRQVRAEEEFKQVHFIMIAAEAKIENVIAAKQAGVNNYIVKPFNAATLRAKVDAVMGDF